VIPEKIQTYRQRREDAITFSLYERGGKDMQFSALSISYALPRKKGKHELKGGLQEKRRKKGLLMER